MAKVSDIVHTFFQKNRMENRKHVVPDPHKLASKKVQIAEMFDHISPKYDFLNRTLSMGIDTLWRKKAVAMLRPGAPKLILDVATGTADLAIQALSLIPDKVIGVDISEGMLEVGRKKIARLGLQNKIELKYGDSEQLDFAENTFDAVMVAFGVRNFAHLEKGLANLFAVLKPGGQLMILEFSQPESFPFKHLYHFYFKHILPKIGNSISKNQSAYTYLPESVQAFPYGSAFVKELSNIGFQSIVCKPLTFGISSLYHALKP